MRQPKKRRIDTLDKDEGPGADQGVQDAAGARDPSLPMLHTEGSSASSTRPPHKSITLPVPAAKGRGPASLPGRFDGQAASSAPAMIQPQRFSAKKASASTTDPGLEAQEAQGAPVPAPQSPAAVEAVVRNIEHAQPSANSATIAERAPIAAHDVEFDFEDLLDVPASSALQVLPGAIAPKRGSLVRHMSARSEAGSEAGTPCEHHVNTPFQVEHD